VKVWWLIVFLSGVVVGFVAAHTMPHSWTAPAWERRR
jgi:hypothetical protein